jgi:hypothetical protein
MILSQLIAMLQDAKKKNGDIEVKMVSYAEHYDEDDSAHIEGTVTVMDEEDKTPEYVLICDNSALDIYL